MNKLILALIAICIIFILFATLTGCKKEENKNNSPSANQYQVIVTITGQGSYTYQLGQYKESGHCKDLKVINRYASEGDYFESFAIADSSNSTICIESNRVSVSRSKQCINGIQKIGVSYQF